ncbi:hypothetical protein JCM6882_003796 [Rhodosporidiobolus microsporus]
MFSSIHVQLSLAQVASSRLVDAEGRVSFLSAACQPHFLPFVLPTSGDPAVLTIAENSFEKWNGDAPATSNGEDLEHLPSSTDLGETFFSSSSSAFSGPPTLRRSTSSSSLASSTASSLFSAGAESITSSFSSSSPSSTSDEVDLAASSSPVSSAEHSYLHSAADDTSPSPSAHSSRRLSRPSPSPSPLDRLPSPFTSDSPSKFYRRKYLDGITKLTGELNALLPSSFAVGEEQVHGFYRRWCRA